MNQKNLEYLTDQIKFTGFGETMQEALKDKMLSGDAEFKLNHESKYGTDIVTATLNFKKSDQSDMYFFNSYNVSLQKDTTKEALEQIFYINKDNNITAKEAYNLMDGRSVNKDLKNKEGEVYNCWLKMNFKESDEKGDFKLNHYHQNYGYDLEVSLAKHPIKELETPAYKQDLINSLKKGNIQSVTFKIDGVEKKQFVEANPHFKTINVYDGSLNRINNKESKDEKQEESEGKSNRKDMSKTQENGDEPVQNQEKAKAKKKKQGNSL